MYKFALLDSVAAKARTVTREIFDAILDSPIVAETCLRIAEIHSLISGCPDAELRKLNERKVSELKRSLPAFCWHATFKNGKRNSFNAIPSGLVMLDIDHIDNPQETFEHLKDDALRLNLVAAHITPSLQGLRLVFAKPLDISIEDAQNHLTQRLNLANVDTCTKDLARLSFIVPRSYWLYVDYEALFGEVKSHAEFAENAEGHTSKEMLQDAACRVSTQRISRRDRQETPNEVVGEDNHAETQGTQRTPSVSGREDAQVRLEYEKEYKGIPYSCIVQALEALYGGKPEHGNRNTQIFSMACALRHICNDDPIWVSQVLPTYGEAESKWMSSIKSACQRNQSASMPPILLQAIEMAKNQIDIPKDNKAVPAFDDTTPPQMPDKLPKLIRLLVKNVPEVCRPSVANGVFPALATHLSDVTFRLIDGTFKEPNFMCVTMARQSSGKASINKPIEYIMADIKEQDDINRKREQEWKDSLNTKGSNKEKPKRPDDLCIRILVTDMTHAAFVQRLKDANGKYVYTNLEELDMLRQLQTNGMKDIGKIICLCFDNGIYGQERVGNQSVTALLPLRWNWNASSTIEKGLDFFRGRLIDGTLSRINFSTIVNDDTKEFRYGDYNEDYAKQLKPYITNLNLCKGEVICDKALAMARRLQQKCTEIALQTEDVIYQEFAFRAVTIAYMKAMVLYIANDMTWDKSIEDFCEWSLEYDLWVKNFFFGSEIRDARTVTAKRKSPGKVNMLTHLPDVFTFADAQEMRKRAGHSIDGTAVMLRVWVHRGYITYNDEKEMYEKTPKFKQKS